MAKTIYKYELKPADVQTIMMPQHAQILTVQNQHDKVNVWALVESDPLHIQSPVTFYIVGTGNDASEAEHKKYLGTVQLAEGAYIFHVFYEESWA